MTATFTYLELFAGVGGLGDALAWLGGQCVFAAEIDEQAQQTFADRHPHLHRDQVIGDVLTLTRNDDGSSKTLEQIRASVPNVDAIAGGPPCQDFSKSGAQAGADGDRGSLTGEFFKIVEAVTPKFVVMENVRNLLGRRHRDTYDAVLERLDEIGYTVHLDDGGEPLIRSPHLLAPEAGGTPQFRERLFLIAVRKDVTLGAVLDGQNIDVATIADGYGYEPGGWDVLDLLEDDDAIEDLHAYALPARHVAWIDAWNELLQALPIDQLPAELWADAFTDDLEAVFAAHEVDQPGKAHKIRKLQRSHDLYTQHRDLIDAWMRKPRPACGEDGQPGTVADFPATRKILEFQARSAQPTQADRNLWACSLQLRSSGIRVKPLTYLPALVALNNAPVIGPLRRTITPREAWRLQSLSVPAWSADVAINTDNVGPQDAPVAVALHPAPRFDTVAPIPMPTVDVTAMRRSLNLIVDAWAASEGVCAEAVDVACEGSDATGLSAAELLVAAASAASADLRFCRPGAGSARLLWDTYTLLAEDGSPLADDVALAACDWRVRARMLAAAGRNGGQQTTADAMRHGAAHLPLDLPRVDSVDGWDAAAREARTAVEAGWPVDWTVRLLRSRLLSVVGDAPGQRPPETLMHLDAALRNEGLVVEGPHPAGPAPDDRRSGRLQWAQRQRDAAAHTAQQRAARNAPRLWIAEVADATAHQVVAAAQHSYECIIAEQGFSYADEGAEWSFEELHGQIELADAYALCVSGVPDVPTMVALANYERFRQKLESAVDVGLFDDESMAEHFGERLSGEGLSYRLWDLTAQLEARAQQGIKHDENPTSESTEIRTPLTAKAA